MSAHYHTAVKFARLNLIVLLLTTGSLDTPRHLPSPIILDPTFGIGGQVTTRISSGIPGASISDAYALVMQPDGKLVVAGSAYESVGGQENFAIVRYNDDGSLDTTFNSDGLVTTDFGGSYDKAFALALQSDGKLVAAGIANGNNEDIAVTRYNPDGSLDPTFDDDGKVTTDFYGYNDRAQSIALQSDSKVIVAGYAVNGNVIELALVRYNGDGSLDTTFNGTGKVVTILNSSNQSARASAIQADGKIVVGGMMFDGSLSAVLVRYNTEGGLDATFGNRGTLLINHYQINALAIQADGKLVVAGSGQGKLAVARYHANGDPDTTFSDGGLVFTDFNNGTDSDTGNALAIQPDDKIVVVGETYLNDTDRTADFAIARYNDDGSLDTAFDGDGKLTTNFDSPFHSTRDHARGVAVQPDGKLVVAGTTHPVVGYNVDDGFALARYITQIVWLAQTVDDASPDLGQLITYTVTLSNGGPVTLTNALISGALPAGVTYAGPVMLEPQGAGIAGVPPNLVTDLTVAVGQSITLTIPVTIDLNLPTGTVITNTVSMTSTEVTTPITASVTITSPAPPIARDDFALVEKNTATTLYVLVNDGDPNGDQVALIAVGTPINGTATLNGYVITYTPTMGFTGTDVFTYTVGDGVLNATATVTISVVDQVHRVLLPLIGR